MDEHTARTGGQVAVITGGSRGFGFELARSLAADGWQVVIDGRDADAAHAAAVELGVSVHAVPGDVTDAAHRAELLQVAEGLGELTLLVNNASALGPSPQPPLADYPLEVAREVYDVNVIAPIGLIQAALPALRRNHGTIVDVTSDAAVEGYAGWGGYGSSKAALEQVSNVLAVEEPDVRVYWFDPGDMRTQMHQEAFPGEDISDRALPATVVPALRRLLDASPPSGRWRAATLLAEVAS
ncbi:MAG: putative short chain dehydrogenase [Ilumatobacteraceae bacterium]|nr:putative short chain dehydrogenase [Ilumatobacteraceae bacterium]